MSNVSKPHPSFEEALRCAKLWIDRPLSDEEWEQANRTQALPAIRPDIELLARAVVGLFEQFEVERNARLEALNDMQVIIDLATPHVERHTAFVHIARIARFYREAHEDGSNPAKDSDA